MKHTIRLALCLVFCLVMFAPVFAGGKYDSLYSKVSSALLHKMALRQQENEALKKKGLPGNYVVYITDDDVARQDTFPQHLLPLLQQNTSQSDVEKLWNFASNEYLKPVAEKIQSFSAEQGFDYYIVVCAIYNYFRLDENTDFSNVTWTNSNLLKSNEPVVSNTTARQDTGAGYHKLADYLRNKFENDPRYKRGNKPTLYHFVMSTYIPDDNATDSRPVGKLRHFQALYWSTPTDAGFDNAIAVFLRNRQADLAGSNNNKQKEASKEEWLLSSVSATQDFIATVRNFKESDLMAKNWLNMLPYLKSLKQLELILSSISFVTREHVINVLDSGDLADDYLIPSMTSGGENAMLAVIRTTPAGQADSLKQLLSKNTYQLLKDLDSKFNDAGLPGTSNNYTRFVQILTNVLVSGISVDDLAEIFKKNRVYKLSEGAAGQELESPLTGSIQEQFDKGVRDTITKSFHRDYSTVRAELDDMTLYKVTSFSETWSYQSLADAYYKQAQDGTYVVKPVNQDRIPTGKEFLDPFDMILVFPQEDFTTTGFKLDANSYRLIPLYYYYWLRQKHESDGWMKIAEDIGNPLLVMSMATGVGEMIEGGNLASQAIRGARVLFDAKLFLNSVSKGGVDEWLKKKLGEAGFSAYKFIEFVYLSYGITKGGIILAYKVGDVFTSALVDLCKIISTSPELLAEIKTNASAFSALNTYFKNVLGRDLEEAVAEAGSGMPPPALASMMPSSEFLKFIRKKYPKLYDRYTVMSGDLMDRFAKQYGDLEIKGTEEALIKFNKNAAFVEEWKYWQGLEKTPVNSWEEAVKIVEDLLVPYVNKLKVKYSDMKIGYRGSLATSKKYSTGDPFNPAKFDCDAAIVSDKLAKMFPKDRRWRDARLVDPEIEQACIELEEAMKKIGGYKWEPGKPFTFRVWTEREYNNKVFEEGKESWKFLYDGK